MKNEFYIDRFVKAWGDTKQTVEVVKSFFADLTLVKEHRNIYSDYLYFPLLYEFEMRSKLITIEVNKELRARGETHELSDNWFVGILNKLTSNLSGYEQWKEKNQNKNL